MNLTADHMRYCRNSVFYSEIVPKEDRGGESKRSGVRSVTANFRYTNVNGVCMRRFGTVKTIRDFGHQDNSLESHNLEL